MAQHTNSYMSFSVAAKKNAIPVFLFIGALLVIFPYYFYNDLSNPSAVVDNGWQWALHFFASNFDRYHWGRDVIYTYGPLGVLSTRTFPASMWLVQFLFDAYLVFNLSTIFNILLRQYGRKAACLYAIALLTGMWEVNWLLQISNVMLLLLMYQNPGRHRLAYIIAFNIALLLFIKLNTLLSVVFVLGTMLYLLAIGKKYKSIAGSLGLLLVSMAVIAHFTQVSFKPYFATSMDTVAYYTYSMYYFSESYRNVLYAGLLFSAVFAGFCLYFFYRQVREFKKLSEIILLGNIALLYFILFKQGFTRFDRDHFTQYFCLLPFVIVCLYLLAPAMRKMTTAFLAVAVLGVTGLGGMIMAKGYDHNTPLFSFRSVPVVHYATQLMKIASQPARQYTMGASYDYYANQCINQSRNGNGNWHNRPAFQSIVTVSSYIDSINAAYYNGATAPDTIFYDGQSVDNRNALWDDPICKWVLFTKYQYAGIAAHGQVFLTKRQQALRLQRTLVLDTTVGFNQPLNLPQQEGGVLVMNAELKLKTLGKLKASLFQPPATTVKLHLTDVAADTLAPFRFIPPLHNNQDLLAGIYGPPADTALFRQLMSGFNTVKPNVRSLEFLTDQPSGVVDKIRVKLYFVISSF